MESSDIRNAGLKVTLPRVKILEILEQEKHDKHLSAEKVYKILLSENEEIGLATVYRVLTQFETAGLVTRHHFEGSNSVFSTNWAANIQFLSSMKGIITIILSVLNVDGWMNLLIPSLKSINYRLPVI